MREFLEGLETEGKYEWVHVLGVVREFLEGLETISLSLEMLSEVLGARVPRRA